MEVATAGAKSGPETALPPAGIEATASAPSADAPRRCFICLMDEEPSDPRGSWVDPCPCTLEAHQDCMLSWVVDCERSNKPLKCPVCKSAIEMEGPWDPIASLHDAIQRKFTRASPFLLLTGLSVGVQFSLQMYGAVALWTFAGKDALLRFALGPNMGATSFAKERIVNALILMNVAPTLLVSQLLPGLSNKYFVQSASVYAVFSTIRNDHFLEWPPSPQLAMVLMPMVRRFYFNLWRDFVLPYEVKLNRQINGLPPLEPRQMMDRHDLEHNGEGGFVGLLQNILDVLDPDEDELVPRLREEVHVAHEEEEVMVEFVIEDVDEEDLEERRFGERENGRQHPEQAPQPEHRREPPQAPPARRMGLGGLLSNVSNSIVGALLLPGVSFAMGEALRLVLPRSWTVAPPKNAWLLQGARGRPGLLQQQWGRSLVGGCLYVVLNDALRVYSKTRKVAAMENRRVKNVERRRRRNQ